MVVLHRRFEQEAPESLASVEIQFLVGVGRNPSGYTQTWVCERDPVRQSLTLVGIIPGICRGGEGVL